MSLKSFFKSISKTDTFRTIVCWVGAQYIRFVYATGRWDEVNAGHAKALWAEGKPFILAFWHGRLLMMPYCWARGKTIHMLISQHPDGRLIADTVNHFGIKTIAGSTSKGGAAALRGMLKALKSGDYVGITPDGPRGPRMRASNGIVTVAKMSGVPVIACAFGITRRKHLGSWDRFALAKPFGRGVFVWSDPLVVGRDDDAEQARLDIETALTNVTDEADRLTGHPAIEPAPAQEPPS